MKYFECVNCERRGDCPRVSCQMERLANGEWSPSHYAPMAKDYVVTTQAEGGSPC